MLTVPPFLLNRVLWLLAFEGQLKREARGQGADA